MTQSTRREALLARFRHGSLARVDAMIEQLRADEPHAGADLRAALHTLKGEARMLGLASLSAFVHAIEDAPGNAVELGAVLEFVREWLEAPLVEDREAAARLERGRALLDQLEPLAEAPPRVGALPTPGLRVSMVRTEAIDELCDRLEQLRADLGRKRRAPTGADVERYVIELDELTELAWSLRLVPVEPALRDLCAHALALADELGKQVRVVVDAGGAQLERTLLEALHEPLLHLINNSLAHGIEAADARGPKPTSATLSITARSHGHELELELADDGRGVDLERVRRLATDRGLLDPTEARAATPERLHSLLFEPGFSTASAVDEVSGRGMGLAVVRSTVEGLGGEVTIDSRLGSGARFVMRVPATISREPVLVFELAGVRWGLAARRVGPIVALDQDPTRATVIVEDEHVPLVSLARLLGVREAPTPRLAICCRRAGRRFALACHGLLGEHELLRRPLGPTLARVCPASASAVMDDGHLVLLLEPAALLDRRIRELEPEPREPAGAPAGPSRPRTLIVDDSAIVRELLGELLRGAGFEVAVAGDGHEALAVLRRAGVDLVLADIEMPNMDGFALLSRIRELDPELPVVMLTTRASQSDRRQAAELGASAYLIKSEFREHGLLETIARFVELPA